MTGEEDLREWARYLNKVLQEQEEKRPARAEIRKKLARVGKIRPAPRLGPERMAGLARGRPLVGVDGSVNSYGGGYPHAIHFFRALASPSTAPAEGIVLTDIFCPLLPEHREEIAAQVAAAELGGEKLTPEAAAARLIRERLARLEVRAALRVLDSYHPFLVLFDGGFLRYGDLAAEEWQHYRAASLARDITSIGVIEEIGTFDLAPSLLDQEVYPWNHAHDRELLYNVLAPGEWLQVGEELELKRGYYTCFARPGTHPQAVAYDFFREQTALVPASIPLLFGLTPRQGRGIPWWLDRVDRAVRITNHEMEILLEVHVDRNLRECFLVPQRERRGL